MRKGFLTIGLIAVICVFSTGCETKKQIETNKNNIKEYIKETISGNWGYSEDKLYIDDDYTTTITLYNVDNWVSCVDNSEQFAKLLKDNLKDNLKIGNLYFACKTSANDEVNSYIEISDISKIDISNYKQEINALDNSKNKITENYKEASTRIRDEYINKCNAYNYKDVFRHSEDYKGKYAKFTGEVVQVLESDGYYSLRINVTNNDGWYEDTIFVTLSSNSFNGRILEDDIVTIYGKLAGLYEYESIFGEPITIPLLNAEYIDLL